MTEEGIDREQACISPLESREGPLSKRNDRITRCKEVVGLAGRRKEYTVHVTHTYTHDPEAVERGLQLWASYLARHLIRRLAEEGPEKREG